MDGIHISSIDLLILPQWYHLAIAVFLAVLIGLMMYAFRMRNLRATIYFTPTPKNESLLSQCHTMMQYDRVPVWGINGHVQSIYASQLRKGPTYPLRREQLENRHGGLFAIDWLEAHDNPMGFICIVPGIAGHTGNDYIKNFIHYCKMGGYNVVSYNWPGCGEHVLNYMELSTLGDSTDLSIMFNHIRKLHPETPMYGVGFSLGANLLLRYLGQVKKHTPLKSAIALSAGYCGRSGYLIMKKNQFYSKKLVKKWKEVVLKSEVLWKDHPAIDLAQVRKAENLEQLDEALSAKILQYDQTIDYYTDHGSIDWLEHIRIPTLLVNALDDPIIKSSLVELAKAKIPLNDIFRDFSFPYLLTEHLLCKFFSPTKQNLILTTTKYGGHMGWARSSGLWRPDGELWMDRVALEFIEAIRNTLGPDP